MGSNERRGGEKGEWTHVVRFRSRYVPAMCEMTLAFIVAMDGVMKGYGCG